MSDKVRLRIALALIALVSVGAISSISQFFTSPERAAERQEAIKECRKEVLDAYSQYGNARGNSRVNSTDLEAAAMTKVAIESCESDY